MRSPRDFLIELLASFLWDGAKYAGGTLLLGASVYVIKNRNRPWLEELPKHSIALAFILGAFGVCLLTLAVYRTLRYSPPLPKQDYDFDQMDRCITFEYHSLERYTYRKRIVLRARRSGLSIFTDKYRWTGKIQPHVKSGIKGQSVHPTDRKSVWQFYEIRFPKTLKKGEQVETDLIFEL